MIAPGGRINTVRPNTNLLSTNTGRAVTSSNAAMGSTSLTNATMGGPIVKRTTTTAAKRTTTFSAKTKADTGKGSVAKGNTDGRIRNSGQADTRKRPSTTVVTTRTNPDPRDTPNPDTGGTGGRNTGNPTTGTPTTGNPARDNPNKDTGNPNTG